MDENKKLYFIIPDDGSELDDIEAIFDSRQKAEAYNKRYKTDSGFEIMERVFDPRYETDHTRDPYRVTIDDNSEHAVWVTPHHHLADIESAKNEHFEIDNTMYSNYELPILRILLFAESKEAALKRALEIRDELILNGEWQEALERYNTTKRKQSQQKPYRSTREKELEKWLTGCVIVIILLIFSFVVVALKEMSNFR